DPPAARPCGAALRRFRPLAERPGRRPGEAGRTRHDRQCQAHPDAQQGGDRAGSLCRAAPEGDEFQPAYCRHCRSGGHRSRSSGGCRMTEQLTIGFLPLVDACLPILAQEHGFAEEEGLTLTFQRDVSWATVLDRLLYGHSDAAHMIAPLAITTTLGRGRPAQPLAAPFVLGLNGNAITMSAELAERVAEPGRLSDPIALGAALAEEARARRASGRKLRFGVVHRYSSHNYMLRYWLAGCGLRPDEDVEISTVSPPFVADAMKSGEIDGACVGEPWNSAAVERGVGVIVLATAQIWRRGVEKVLAFRAPVLEDRRPAAEALIRAMRKTGAHFVDPANWERNAEILSRPHYLDA